MLENVTLGQTRGVKAEDLDGKTENLQKSATDFQRRSHTVRREMWWKDMKMRICIVVGIIILLIVIIVPSGMLAPHPKILISLTLTRSSCCFKTYLSSATIVGSRFGLGGYTCVFHGLR